MDRLRRFFRLIVSSGERWSADECARMSAAIAYFAVFSLFPLLLLCVAGVGFVVGRDDALRDRLLEYVARSSTPEAAPLLRGTLASLEEHQTARGVGAVVGFVTLLLGASGAFSELESSLNAVWHVAPPKDETFRAKVVRTVRDKALSFAVALGASITLLVLLVLSSGLSALRVSTEQLGLTPLAWIGVETGVSVILLTLPLAAMFRLIPRTRVDWKDVWAGALLTAALFTLLKRLLAWYFGHLGSYAAYGAVGGLLALLAWIYMVTMILLYGAEFSHAYAEQYGSLRGGRPPSPASDVPTTSGEARGALSVKKRRSLQ